MPNLSEQAHRSSRGQHGYTAIKSNGLRYDYLLVVGPGRSGSTFLHDILDGHKQFQAPKIKEGYYYRRPAEVVRLCSQLGATILLDVANLAYKDPTLEPKLAALHECGVRTLVVVLYRDHRERAISMLAFRRSRGEFSAWFGKRHLETTVLRDALTGAALTRIYGVEADVLTVAFSTLTTNTSALLQTLANLCGSADFGDLRGSRAAESSQARNMALSAIGKLCALAMRRLKLYRTLQRLKRSPLVEAIFFKHKGASAAEMPSLSAESERQLADCAPACQAAIERSSECVAHGVWLKRTTRR